LRTVTLPPRSEFLIGAATSAFQVEGGLDELTDYGLFASVHPAFADGEFVEPCGIACDHFNRFEDDIRALAELGLDSYRFGIEWARIEPRPGVFDATAIEHYRDVIHACRDNGIVPVVTLHHFSSPRWLIQQGGWGSRDTPGYFARYAKLIAETFGGLIAGGEDQEPGYICTINEVNTGALNETHHGPPQERVKKAAWQATCARLGVHPDRFTPFQFASSDQACGILMSSHAAAVKAIHDVNPKLHVGLTMASQDIVPNDMRCEADRNAAAELMWSREDRFWAVLKAHFPAYAGDFIGVQSYTHLRASTDATGRAVILPPAAGARLVKMGYEFAPHALANCARHTAAEMPGVPLLLTEYGIGTDDDRERVEYYQSGIADVADLLEQGIPVKGIWAWSAMDNFEWEIGYAPRFGMQFTNYETQVRTPKPSAFFLSRLADRRCYQLPRHIDSRLRTKEGGGMEFGSLGGDGLTPLA
jgi:beta-glucosidase